MHILQAVCGALLALTLLVPRPAAAISEIINLDRAKRGNVAFTHQKHAYTYDIACGDCHHNISPIRQGENTCRGCHEAQQHSGLCRNCHLSNRDSDYDERIAQVRKELKRDDVPNLFKAFHNRCRNCHDDVNKQHGRKAPFECGGCHR